MATKFVEIYNRFLGDITDDLYIELTPEDTHRDLQNLLIQALPEFEFPKINLMNYTINTEEVLNEDLQEDDFIIKQINDEDIYLIDKSYFEENLTQEEILILAKIMLNTWLQRQITSIENTRMKYSGADFKMTSQANHLSKLITLQDKVKQQIHHFQRLYHRRRLNDNGKYESNWDVFKKTNYYYDD